MPEVPTQCERRRPLTALHPLLILVLLTCALWSPVLAGDGLLRVGIMKSSGGATPASAEMERLRRFLQDDPDLAQAMKGDGYSRIGVVETDGERDMLLRLNAGEFEAAFLPSRLWAEQTAGYTVILQMRRVEDMTFTRGGLVVQRGIVVAGPGFPFVDAGVENMKPTDLAAWLSANPVAAVSTQSVAGYVAPMLKLGEEIGTWTPPPRIIWFNSSSDVARAVVSGLADVGICEEGEFELTLREAESGGGVRPRVSVLQRSVPVPTDPVVLRSDLSLRKSLLGRELKRTMMAFSLGGGFADSSLQDATDDDFTEVRALLRRWQALSGEIGP